MTDRPIEQKEVKRIFTKIAVAYYKLQPRAIFYGRTFRII